MSKMQELLDRAQESNKRRKTAEAIDALVEAIKLLSRGQQQVMRDFNRAQADRTDIPIT